MWVCIGCVCVCMGVCTWVHVCVYSVPTMQDDYFIFNPPPPQVCIIPQSAHGTNPASAQMAGLRIVQVPTKSDGSTSVEDFKKLVSWCECGDVCK